jgi:hypothetical protein
MEYRICKTPSWNMAILYLLSQIRYRSCNLSCHSGTLLCEETAGRQPTTIYIQHNVTLRKMTSSRIIVGQAEEL